MKKILSILLSAVILSSTACLTACGFSFPSFKTTPDETGEQTTSYTQDEPLVPELPTASTEKENDEQPSVRPTTTPEKPNVVITPVENIDKDETEKPSQQADKTDGTDSDTITPGIRFSLINNGTEYCVSSAHDETPDIVIPEYYNGLPVTKISNNGFLNRPNLKSVHIPKTVKIIGSNAFGFCTSLEMVTGMDGVTSIGSSAFMHCEQLDRITLPITLTELGSEIFRATSTTVFIRKTEEEMKALNPKWSYKRAENARTVYIGPDMPSGDDAALDKIMEFEPIRNGTEYRVGRMLQSVTELTIPLTYNGKPVTEIYSLYSYKYDLVEVSISDSVLEISSNVFMNCETLEAVYGMRNVKRIMEYGFCQCRALNQIEFPSSLEFIGENAFRFCQKLKGQIEFSSSLKYIGDEAFLLGSIEGLRFNGKLDYLGKSAFEQCDIIELILPKSLKIIEDNAFARSLHLERLILPLDVEYIGEQAFIQCQSVKEIVFPSSLEYIGSSAFAICDGFERVVLPSNLKYLGDKAFYYCRNLKELVMPLNLEYIGDNVFTNTYIR